MTGVEPRRCPASGKVMLPKGAARANAAHARGRGEKMEAFPCPVCLAWHTGHRTAHGSRARRSRRNR